MDTSCVLYEVRTKFFVTFFIWTTFFNVVTERIFFFALKAKVKLSLCTHEGTYVEWRRSSTHSPPRHCVEVSVEPHTSTTLFPEGNPFIVLRIFVLFFWYKTVFD